MLRQKTINLIPHLSIQCTVKISVSAYFLCFCFSPVLHAFVFVVKLLTDHCCHFVQSPTLQPAPYVLHFFCSNTTVLSWGWSIRSNKEGLVLWLGLWTYCDTAVWTPLNPAWNHQPLNYYWRHDLEDMKGSGSCKCQSYRGWMNTNERSRSVRLSVCLLLHSVSVLSSRPISCWPLSSCILVFAVPFVHQWSF